MILALLVYGWKQRAFQVCRHNYGVKYHQFLLNNPTGKRIQPKGSSGVLIFPAVCFSIPVDCLLNMKFVTLDIPNAQPHQFAWTQPCDYRKTIGVNLLVE